MSKTLLVVDDDEMYAILLPRLFEKVQPDVRIEFAADGQEAIDYLLGVGKYADREFHPFPYLMLVDIKMPRVNGFEVLEWKNKRGMDLPPAIVWSSSDLKTDVDKALALGAIFFIRKPLKLTELEEIVPIIKPKPLGQKGVEPHFLK